MSDHEDRVDLQGVRFFGRISADISHEIKNKIAIINENAGLLEDLTVLAEKGIPPDTARLKRIAEIIQKHVYLADRIVKNMNRFSHSADEPTEKINLIEIIDLMTALTDRYSRLHGVGLETAADAAPVIVTTAPFMLENLIWRCLKFAVQATQKDTTIKISAETAETGARILMRWGSAMRTVDTTRFPLAADTALARVLGAELHYQADTGELSLYLPDHLNIAHQGQHFINHKTDDKL